MSIEIFDKWSNTKVPSRPSPDSHTHGLSNKAIEELHNRFNSISPSLIKTAGGGNRFRSMFDDALPEGASWDPITKNAQWQVPGFPAGGGKTMTTVETPYQPEFASPDRQNYPVHRILANRYWRLFYKLDPVVGNCIDLYSELPWSNFELTGDGVEGEIRQAYEYMCRESQLLAVLPYLVKEFLILGEAVPHTFFDSEKGVFTYIAMHNPDQLEVIDAPFVKMDPIVEFIPDDRLRAVLTADQPALRRIREKMPPELLSRLFARENIPLSPLNCTFIPRKLHPYDTRGTSLLSRMWRVFMLEDAIFNANIQIARRHASPLKVAKLGNAATGWIPPPEQEKKLLELLVQAEQDPNAWLVYHYGIQFDTVGTTDRVISVNREWEIIERIKLVALGVSKAFLHGEVSYASAASGLQIFLQRLKSLRLFFEQKWLYPKLFKPIAEINGWIKPKPTEVNHRYRIKRSAKELEEQNAYIIPKVVWDKTLDPQINTELINAITALEALGVKFSKTTKMASAGYSFEEETKKIHREMEFEKAFLPKIELPPQQGEGGPPGAGGGPPPPPPGGPPGGGEEGKAPPGAGGEVPPGVTPPATPPKPGQKPGASKDGVEIHADDTVTSVSDIKDEKPGKSSIEKLKSQIWTDDKHGNWEAGEVSDLLDLILDSRTDSAFWTQMAGNDFSKLLQSGDMNMIWDHIDNYLQQQGYPDKDIQELQHILEAEHILMPGESTQLLQDVEHGLPDNADSMSDEDFATAVAKTIKASKNKISFDNVNLLSGSDSRSNKSDLIGDISDLIGKK